MIPALAVLKTDGRLIAVAVGASLIVALMAQGARLDVTRSDLASSRARETSLELALARADELAKRNERAHTAYANALSRANLLAREQKNVITRTIEVERRRDPTLDACLDLPVPDGLAGLYDDPSAGAGDHFTAD